MPENELVDSAVDSATAPADTAEPAVENEKIDTPPSVESQTEDFEDKDVDYEALVNEDMRILSEEFSNAEPIKVTDLKDPVRYGALRDLGLTPKEAFLASGGRIARSDNRAHLHSSVPRNMTSAFSEIPRAHLDMARELFSGLSDSEIRTLYRKVTQ